MCINSEEVLPLTVNLSNSRFGGALALLIASGLAVLFSAKPLPPRAEKTRFVSTNEGPLHFEPTDAANTAFIARGRGYSVLLAAGEMLMRPRGSARDSTVGLRMAGGDPNSRGCGVGRLPGRSNYYIGNDPEKWRRDVPHFARVRFDEVYPGIDVVYYDARRERGEGPAGQLEYDFIVEPDADPRRIQLQFQGTEEISFEPDGGLRLRTASGEVRQERPVVYQEIAQARRPVGGRYVRSGAVGVAFEVGLYDRSRPLVIDPKVEYSTYLGGSGDDQAFGIDVGPDGSVYVVGWTESADFPAGSSPALTGSGKSPQQGRPGTGRDAFFTRFDNSLSESLVQNFFGDLILIKHLMWLSTGRATPTLPGLPTPATSRPPTAAVGPEVATPSRPPSVLMGTSSTPVFSEASETRVARGLTSCVWKRKTRCW